MSAKQIIGAGALGAITSVIACHAEDETPGRAPAGADAPPSLDATLTRLKEVQPDAEVFVRGERIRRIYGTLATGATPGTSAETFRNTTAAALGVPPEDLVPAAPGGANTFRSTAAAEGIGLMADPITKKSKFRLFTYAQSRDGVPVFRAGLRTLVRADGDHAVVWANSDVRPLGDFRPPAAARPGNVDLAKSLRAVRANPAHPELPAPTSLVAVGTPTPTIFAGVGTSSAAPRWAMQYTAREANGPGRWTFVADATTGDILHVESDLHFDVVGTVEAEVTAGQGSMDCSPTVVVPLPYAEVTSPAGNALTDATGTFTIGESSGEPLTVTSAITGEYFTVIDHAGDLQASSEEVTPPGPVQFLHRDPADPPEYVLAQLNAYVRANELRDLLLTYIPDYPLISTERHFEIHVNRSEFVCEMTGGAWYNDEVEPHTLNFCRRAEYRNNAAFGSIVHHEYGHHIVDSGGSGQAEYGEAMADIAAMLIARDPRMGLGYRPTDCEEAIRRADRDCRYDENECSSCGPGIYECSGVLTGAVWDMWQELDVTAPASADDIVRSLVFSSIPLHTGGDIDPSIVVDLLVLDDDDGLVENGTPHYAAICAGFGAHDLHCPPIVDGLVVQGADLYAQGPSDGPFAPESVTYTLHNLGPDDMTYAVVVPADASWITVDDSGGAIPVGEQTTVTVSIVQGEAAALPDGDYTAAIEFVNETFGTGTVIREARLRVGALEPVYTATFEDDLEGYVVDGEYGNLWHRSTACADELPGHSTPGSLYYGIDERCNYTTSVPILHTVTSPAITIANPDTVEFGFNYYLRTENDPNYDSATLSMSVEGGPFELLASNNRGGYPLLETNAWESVHLDISDRLPSGAPTTIHLQLAFNAGDPDVNIRTGFVVDDITVYARPAAPRACGSDSECDDGRYCNGLESCVDGVCIPGEFVDCDDGNLCTNDTCDDATGCVYENNAFACADDGDECTFDTCQDGVCTHPDNGLCGVPTPCSAFCSNPIVFGGTHYQSGNLGTQAACHETTAPLASGVCGNLAGGRLLSVNGVPMNCNWNLWTLPPAVNGGYCIHTTAGDYPWASFSTWTH